MTDPAQTFEVGGERVTITTFRAFKGLVAGDILSSQAEAIGELAQVHASWRREFAEQNPMRLSHAQAKSMGLNPPPIEELPDGMVVLPGVPDSQDVFLKMFPLAFKLARDDVLRLVGLITIPNGDLERADDSDEENGIDRALLAEGKRVFHAGSIREVLGVLNAAVAIIREEMSELDDVLGNLRALLDREPETAPAAQPDHLAPSAEVAPAAQESPESGGEPTQPASATSSQPSTAGDELTSLDSVGETSPST